VLTGASDIPVTFTFDPESLSDKSIQLKHIAPPSGIAEGDVILWNDSTKSFISGKQQSGGSSSTAIIPGLGLKSTEGQGEAPSTFSVDTSSSGESKIPFFNASNQVEIDDSASIHFSGSRGYSLFNNVGNNNSLTISNDSGKALLDISDQGDLSVSNNMIVNASLGIGITPPLAKLHVKTKGAGVLTAAVFENASDGNGRGVQTVYRNSDIELATIAATRGTNNAVTQLSFSTRDSSSGFSPKLIIHTNGGVGIGKLVPSEKLDVNGNIAVSGTVFQNSDKRLKKSIRSLRTSFKKLKYVRGVEFFWRDRTLSAKKQYGFIAQEIEKIFPDLVSKDNDSGHLSVSYQGLIPLMLESMKERDQIIQKNKLTISIMKKEFQKKIDQLEKQNQLYQRVLCSKFKTPDLCK
jgi:hypothetical protein